MKKITIQWMRLRNFKGIELLELALSGKDQDIYGANETGKSTIVTAFNWLLTGKDEFGRADFAIKNSVRKELNAQAHEVEAGFMVAGQEVKLRRVYLEIWTKKKGQSTKEFTGHTTDFFFNDVPCNEREYNEKVAAIIPSDLIRLLTNPTHFTSQPWASQRAELLKIAGTITNDQVIESIATPDKDYGTLIMILNSGKSLEDYKKELAAKKVLLRKAAVEFAPRIAEVKRNIPERGDWDSIASQIAEKNYQLQDIDGRIEDYSKAAAAANQALLEKQQFIYKRESALAGLKNKIRAEVEGKQQNRNGEVSLLQTQIKSTQARLQLLEQQTTARGQSIESYRATIQTLNGRIEKFRTEWRAINAEEFVFDDSKCECPTCGQQLQPEKITEKKEQMRTNFLAHQNQRKNDLVSKSNQVKAEISQYEAMIAKTDNVSGQEDITATTEQLKALQHKLFELENTKPVISIESAVEALVKVNEDALYLEDEIAALKKELESEQQIVPQATTENLKKSKADILLQMEPLRTTMAQKDNFEYSEKRIKQLADEEKVNAYAIAEVERTEMDIEEFSRAKMAILENRVNAKFQFVGFRLFETQVNGGIAETCVCEYKGVAFPTLNTAGKMLAGIDIISTLAHFYKIAAPIFVDNRESVTYLPERESQLISLYVSDADKALRMEEPARTTKSKKVHEKEPLL